MSTWIFLRGLTRESRHWGDFPLIFRAGVPDADVVLLDLPGNGRLNHLRSPTTVAAMAEHCRTELAARGIRPPYHLLAMSLGAMVAVAWAATHPDELGGCVLINTSLRPFNPFYRRLKPRNYSTLLKLALTPLGVQRKEASILRMTSNLSANRAQIVETWSTLRRENPVTTANAIRQLWAASRYHAPARKPPVDVLILASEGDGLVDQRCSRRLARIWKADFASHPGAGHDIALDDGAWVVRQVRDWMQRTGTPA
jgi:pimeloyl-ACP methyl ester carboxylesterase